LIDRWRASAPCILNYNSPIGFGTPRDSFHTFVTKLRLAGIA